MEQLTLDSLVFDERAAREAKDRGMERAANAKLSNLELARSAARYIARSGDGTCNADQVQEWLIAKNIHLGNAAGSIFKGREWIWTGKFIHSKRVASHRNLLRVWQLKN